MLIVNSLNKVRTKKKCAVCSLLLAVKLTLFEENGLQKTLAEAAFIKMEKKAPVHRLFI